MDLHPRYGQHSTSTGELERDLPVRSLNSIAIARIRLISGSDVVSVRIAKVIVSMLLHVWSVRCPPRLKYVYSLESIATGIVSGVDGQGTLA